MDTSTSPIPSSAENQPVEGENISSASKGSSGTVNASTPIGSMADLKMKAPELFDAMMRGLAETIVNEMREHQERLKKMMREGQRQAEGR